MQLDLPAMGRIYATGADALYGGEAITQLEHALQCAELARQAGASPSLISAAFFHDLGHLLHGLGEDCAERGLDDHHERSGALVLARWFGSDVSEPVRLHVEAKRWLCRAESDYHASLSPASQRSWAPSALLELVSTMFCQPLRRWSWALKPEPSSNEKRAPAARSGEKSLRNVRV